MSGTSRVAVCVPAFRELDELRALCESIWECGYPSDAIQIIVAVDGGDPETAAVARAAGARVVSVVPNQGSYAARNAAIRAVEPPVAAVLFTDADCSVAPDWIDAHLRALDRVSLSGGAVEFTFLGALPTPAEWVDSIRHLKQELYVSRDGFAATCNLAVRGDVLDQFVFDASMRTGGDADFCRRATAEGLVLAYTPEARVLHPARPTSQALLSKVRRIAGGVEGQRARWEARVVAMPRITRGAYRRARAAGLDVGPVWGLRACALDYRASRIVTKAVHRMLARPPAMPKQR